MGRFSLRARADADPVPDSEGLSRSLGLRTFPAFAPISASPVDRAPRHARMVLGGDRLRWAFRARAPLAEAVGRHSAPPPCWWGYCLAGNLEWRASFLPKRPPLEMDAFQTARTHGLPPSVPTAGTVVGPRSPRPDSLA